jgi:anaerobic selenocysteine-containing dehydrogenase
VPETVFRQCTLCEAHCGIAVEVEGAEVLRITGDPDDVHSRGYICPKAAALKDLYDDPDRLRQPVKRVAGRWEEIDWDEALDLAAEGIRGVQERHGRDAVATYLGNPYAHSSSVLSVIPLRAALGTRNNHSATSVDQLPQHRVYGEMFGNVALFPIPDLDRTDHVVILGANPSVSNGSLMSAPGARHKLRAIRERGGTVVVVDPRRTETAELASEHVSIRPGGDPYLLLGMLSVLFAEGLDDAGRVAEICDGLDELRSLATDWTPDRVAPVAGVEAATVARLAREFAAAPSAVAYGRVGTCQQETGTLTHWLITALNAVTGNIDREGGAMFTTPAVDITAAADASRLARRLGAKGGPDLTRFGRWTQRVSGLPEMNGELPVAGLTDEILTPGEGQVRGLITLSGNPVLSTPGGTGLEAAMGELEWYVAVDFYVTETTRHADVILPPVSPLERSDVDAVLPTTAVRNYARYSPAAVPKPQNGREDWQILNGLTARLGRGVRGRLAARATSLASPDQLIELSIQAGPHGVARRGPFSALTVGKIKRAKHGIDLGPLEPRLPGALRTDGKRLRLAPEVLLAEARELERVAAKREAALANGFDLMLIGRRQLRSNNSWMHNSARLMKGADRCTALLHPDDALARGLEDGARVRIVSCVGAIEVPLAVTDEMRPGVVSVPHGFGHDREGVGWRGAASKPGASVNDITDPKVLDRLTGNAAFNSVPVRVEPARVAEPEREAAVPA